MMVSILAFSFDGLRLCTVAIVLPVMCADWMVSLLRSSTTACEHVIVVLSGALLEVVSLVAAIVVLEVVSSYVWSVMEVIPSIGSSWSLGEVAVRVSLERSTIFRLSLAAVNICHLVLVLGSVSTCPLLEFLHNIMLDFAQVSFHLAHCGNL
jgi:hypothetical protein